MCGLVGVGSSVGRLCGWQLARGETSTQTHSEADTHTSTIRMSHSLCTDSHQFYIDVLSTCDGVGEIDEKLICDGGLRLDQLT